MLRRARIIGIVLAGAGLAIVLAFGGIALQHVSGDFGKARLLHERNPGNAMYDAQFFVAASELALLLGGATAGALLALNGVTLMLVGGVAERLESGARR
ncbi:MAG: hypothetical protein ABI629_03400 [bacterium]